MKSTVILDAYCGMGMPHKERLGKNHLIPYWYFFQCIQIFAQRETKMKPLFWIEMEPMHLTWMEWSIQFQGIPQKAKLLKSEPKNVLLWYSFQMPTFAGKLNQIAFFCLIWFPQSKKKNRIYIVYEWRIQFPIFWYFRFFAIKSTK